MMRQSWYELSVCFVPLFLAVSPAVGQIGPNDTTIPNQFEFVSAQYFASNGTTNAAITVRFSPGNRSWSGSVSYSAHGGSAISNQDYIPVSGSLSFSGTIYQSFTVPIFSGPSNQPKTVLLFLERSPSDPNAVISRSNAVLNINLPPPPDLNIAPGQNGTVLIWWLEDGTDVFIEKCTSPTTSWGFVSSGYADGQIRWYVEVADGAMALYRLRRPQ